MFEAIYYSVVGAVSALLSAWGTAVWQDRRRGASSDRRWIDCGQTKVGDQWRCEFFVASDVWTFLQTYLVHEGVKVESIKPLGPNAMVTLLVDAARLVQVDGLLGGPLPRGTLWRRVQPNESHDKRSESS